MDGTVLVADDDRTIRTVLTQALTRAGCRVHATGSLVTLKRWVAEGRGDLVISDVVMPDGNGLEALPEIARLRPDLPVIVISAQNTIMTAIQAAEAEAFDYLPKPFDLPDLMKRAAKALARKRLRPGPAPAPGDSADDLPLVGHSPAMQALYKLVARVMNTDLPVMIRGESGTIRGESGTGKSLIARVLHDFSDRRNLPFVVAVPDDLSPAEGVERLLSRAGRGTLLFDGVYDLDAAAQARLTRMLDGLDSLGEAAPRILSTAPPAVPGGQADRTDQTGQAPGAFRRDLHDRLAGVTLSVPALRERLDDIPALADHFLARADRDGLPVRRLSEGAAEALRAHPWPGNLRQLENTLRHLLVTGGTEEISRAEVESALGAPSGAALPVAGGEKLSDSVARHLQRYFDLHGGALPPPGLYQRILPEIELPLIEIALDATGGNQARCADLLGINRNTLRKKITLLGIEVARRRKLM